MSCMGQNFGLFLVSDLSAQYFRIFLLMYPGSLSLPGGVPSNPPRCLISTTCGQFERVPSPSDHPQWPPVFPAVPLHQVLLLGSWHRKQLRGCQYLLQWPRSHELLKRKFRTYKSDNRDECKFRPHAGIGCYGRVLFTGIPRSTREDHYLLFSRPY